MNLSNSLSIKEGIFPRLAASEYFVEEITGLHPYEIMTLVKKITPGVKRKLRRRKSRGSYTRRYGGGRKFSLVLEDRVLLILMYNHLYLKHKFLGKLFNIHNSNVSRCIQWLMPILKKAHSFSGIPSSERKKLDPEYLLTFFNPGVLAHIEPVSVLPRTLSKKKDTH